MLLYNFVELIFIYCVVVGWLLYSLDREICDFYDYELNIR